VRNWRNAAMLFLLMGVNYGLITVGLRMVAKGSYTGVAISDALIAWWGFSIVQRIGKAETLLEKVLYTAGGVSGSLLAMWVTRN
jgi:hypothetical protein